MTSTPAGPIRRIADLPFHAHDPVPLFDLTDDPDPEYAGFGYTRMASVLLTTHDGDGEEITDALVLALHSDPDDAEENAALGEIELEFLVGYDGDEPIWLSVFLSKFLEIWLPLICGDERAIVLALCNPENVPVTRPAGWDGPPIYYALGDAVAWLDRDESLAATIGFVADTWQKI